MRSLDRLTNHNINIQIRALKKSTKLNAELEDLLTKIPQAMSEGYARVLTPNGMIRENELDRLLSIDADIVMCLGMSDPEKSQKVRDAVESLEELLEERKKLVDSLKA
jgi:predicted alternative tryptophan synthase beta-subunit